MVDKIEIDTLGKKVVWRLSGGDKRRHAIAAPPNTSPSGVK